MQNFAKRQTECIWLAGLLLLVSLHFWFPRVNRGPKHDTYSTSAEGKKAFYLLARRSGYETHRNRKPIPALVESLYGTETLCLLGPARYPTVAEWEAILTWVADGGSLLVAARSDDENNALEIPRLDLKTEPNTGPFQTEKVETSLATSGPFVWQSRGQIDISDGSQSSVLVESGGTTQAISRPYGSGIVVVVAADFVFSNQSLAWSDHSNAELAMRLLEEAEANSNSYEIYFDESLNSSGTPKVVGLMLDPFMRPVTVQLLIGLLLFSWWQSRPFGPLLPRSVSARHNIVDHTDMLGMLYFKAGSGAVPVKSYLSQLEGELRLGSTSSQEDRVLSPIAARMGNSTESVKQVFHRARQAAKTQSLERKDAAKVIRRLALVRRAAVMPHEKHSPRRSADDE